MGGDATPQEAPPPVAPRSPAPITPRLSKMSAAEPWRFFCTAGRGLEPFLAREVRARLGATE
ncbi:hypothetical protein EK904_012986, partial [Melospiza melodia maxima]